jgi:uncharacterized membrane protein YqjE
MDDAGSTQYVNLTDTPAARGTEPSLGELVKETAQDLSDLMRAEMKLLVAETKEEAKTAGKGAGMLAGAGVAAHMVALFASLALMWGLWQWIGHLAWGTVIVAALWAVVAAVLAAVGRGNLKRVNPKPEQTVESVKEDVRWVKDRKS